MHDIWNPWHGCVKCSEGCQNCYMYYLDAQRDKNGADIYRTKTGYRYPLSKDRQKQYKVKAGELIRVCMTSDFFLEEADDWKEDAWDVIRKRPDVRFFLLTKRPERVSFCLPDDWGDGWENVLFHVTCENQRRAEERMPLLLQLPFKHKGVMCAPLIGSVSLDSYLQTGQIEQVICGGENYGGSRPCYYDWIWQLGMECRKYDVTFACMETGTYFVKDGLLYTMPSKRVQAREAYRLGLNYAGRPIDWKLYDGDGQPLGPEDLYVPSYRTHCDECGSRLICNGCSDCGKCS